MKKKNLLIKMITTIILFIINSNEYKMIILLTGILMKC